MISLKVWLIQPWEPNPIDAPEGRPWRTGMLANELVERGHTVVWWCSQWAHYTKEFRATSAKRVQVRPGFEIQVLPALGYAKNISIQRLRDHRMVGQGILARASAEPRPDVIVASFPTIEASSAAATWARRHHVPYLVDIRDRYPDLYWQHAPARIQGLVKLACIGMDRATIRTFRGSAALTGNGEQPIEWALKKAGMTRRPEDQAILMTYSPVELTAPERSQEESALTASGVEFDRVLVSFAGSFTAMFDFEPILDAARKLKDSNLIQFVFAGDGPTYESTIELGKDLPNVIFLGRISSKRLVALLDRSSCGLAPYRELENFSQAITNKPAEYAGHELALLSGMSRGLLADLITEYSAGALYKGGADLAATLERMTQEKGLLSGMRVGSGRLFRERFDPRKVLSQWVDLIEQIVDRTGR